MSDKNHTAEFKGEAISLALISGRPVSPTAKIRPQRIHSVFVGE
jgi:hypothetical protein